MDYIIKVMNQLDKKNNLNVIDVGCAEGSLIDLFLNHGFSSIFSIGIDPRRVSGIEQKYNVYIEKAIDNIENSLSEVSMEFYINGGDIRASSLLPMNYDLLTNDLNKRDNKIYIPWADKLHTSKKEIVKVTSLKNVIDEYFDKETIIDYIKIDAEGKDLDIIKSIRKYENIKYISAECSSHKSGITMFKNGSHRIDIKNYMESINFYEFHVENYEIKEDNLTQMCDIIYKNRIF